MRAVRRLVVAVGASLGISVLAAAPASAHTVASVQPTNYRSEIVAVTPARSGLRVRLLDLGRKVELRATGAGDVVVLGYQGEPYLRVGPGGVFENRRSPTLYQNRTQPGGGPAKVPATADAAAPPEWHRTSTGRTARWRDQRTRWEGPDPPSVSASPHRAQLVVPAWHLTLRDAAGDVVVTGRVLWVPGPSPWPWLAASVVVVALCAGLGRRRRWERPLAAALAALLAVSVVRTVGLEAASGKGAASVAATVVATSLVPLAGWIAGAWAVAAIHRRLENGVLAAGVVGFFLAVFALGDVLTLTRSQVQPAFTASFSRAAVSLTLGLGFGLAAASALVVRRLAAEARAGSRAGRRPPPR